MAVGEILNRFISLLDLVSDDEPAPSGIIAGGILPRKSLMFISGNPKVGKSLLAQNISLALASGRSFACFRISECRRVLLVSAEGGYYPNRDRMKTMTESIDMSEDTMRNLGVCFDARMDLGDERSFEWLVAQIKEFKPDVVVLDPLIRFHNEDENASNRMAGIMRALRELIETHDISVIVVHHAPKGNSTGLRGSSALHGELDTWISMETIEKPEEPSTRRKLHFELRHATPRDEVEIELDPETLWFTGESEDHIIEVVNAVRKLGGTAARKAIIAELPAIRLRTLDRVLRDAVDEGELQQPSRGVYHVIGSSANLPTASGKTDVATEC